jgi:hypothetical protein
VKLAEGLVGVVEFFRRSMAGAASSNGRQGRTSGVVRGA